MCSKVSHQLSLSARTLKMIASLVTWSAWEVEMKAWRVREGERKRYKAGKGQGSEEDSDERRCGTSAE